MGRRQFGSVRRLPSGRWQARYWTQTGEERTARQTFATKGDASRFLARVQTEMDRGEWHDPRLARITFGRWVEEYLAGARHKRPTTRARDEVVLRTHFLPELGPGRSPPSPRSTSAGSSRTWPSVSPRPRCGPTTACSRRSSAPPWRPTSSSGARAEA